jgi:kinetochore protein NDC80
MIPSRVKERVISARDRVAPRRRGQQQRYRRHAITQMNEIARRSVLQPFSQENGRTGIPMAVPQSAMKKSTQNKRLSVAGPAARGVYPPAGLAPPSTNPRQSLYRSQNLNPLLASASKHSRTPLQS